MLKILKLYLGHVFYKIARTTFFGRISKLSLLIKNLTCNDSQRPYRDQMPSADLALQNWEWRLSVDKSYSIAAASSSKTHTV